MPSARSKWTYIIGWDGCGSLPIRNGRGITAGLDRHLKTTGELIRPVPTWIDRSTRQVHNNYKKEAVLFSLKYFIYTESTVRT